MKKLSALILSALLLFSLIGTASAAFTDEASIDRFDAEAVEVLSRLKVVTGFPDGSFRPTDTLTRAQAAKILCTVLLGKEADALPAAGSVFSDVPASHWANRFVAYCASKNVVAGVGGGKFDPDGKLSAPAFGKMLLVALGADAKTLTGADWEKNTLAQLAEKHLDYGVKTESKVIDRQSACRLALNAMFYREDDYVGDTLAYKAFRIARKIKGRDDSHYGRPYMLYLSEDADAYWPGSSLKLTASPVYIHENGPITGDAFCRALGVTKLTKDQLTVIRNDILWTKGNANMKSVWELGNRELYYRAEDGIRLEFYYDARLDVYTVLHVSNFCDKIAAVTEPVRNADGSVKTHGSVTFERCGSCPSDDYTQKDVGGYGLFNGLSKGSWYDASVAVDSVAPTYVTGKLEAFEKDKSVTVDGKTYLYPCDLLVAVSADKYVENGGKVGDTVKLVLDPFGFCYAVWK